MIIQLRAKEPLQINLIDIFKIGKRKRIKFMETLVWMV